MVEFFCKQLKLTEIDMHVSIYKDEIQNDPL